MVRPMKASRLLPLMALLAALCLLAAVSVGSTSLSPGAALRRRIGDQKFRIENKRFTRL